MKKLLTFLGVFAMLAMISIVGHPSTSHAAFTKANSYSLKGEPGIEFIPSSDNHVIYSDVIRKTWDITIIKQNKNGVKKSLKLGKNGVAKIFSYNNKAYILFWDNKNKKIVLYDENFKVLNSTASKYTVISDGVGPLDGDHVEFTNESRTQYRAFYNMKTNKVEYKFIGQPAKLSIENAYGNFSLYKYDRYEQLISRKDIPQFKIEIVNRLAGITSSEAYSFSTYDIGFIFGKGIIYFDKKGNVVDQVEWLEDTPEQVIQHKDMMFIYNRGTGYKLDVNNKKLMKIFDGKEGLKFHDLKNGYMAETKDNKIRIIDFNGKQMLTANYAGAPKRGNAFPFGVGENLAAVQYFNGKQYIVDIYNIQSGKRTHILPKTVDVHPAGKNQIIATYSKSGEGDPPYFTQIIGVN
ncbi:hypothetical protein ACTHOQ_18740 [Solibacillus silvestris]|uniref:hypothetical protein n=1 Tax=Solibacillus silvestris TaxID=76853 RepID=UPI003F7E312A